MGKKCESRIVLTQEDACFIEKLIEENMHDIKNVIYNTLGQQYRYLAEDTVNELYLLVCQKVDILKAHDCPKAWLLVASKRVSKGMINKQKREMPSVSPENISLYMGKSDIFEDAVYDIWLENKVPEKLISRLTKREQEIYHKIYIENKKVKDVATELNITDNAVRNIHKNLRDKIKDDINQKNF